MPTNAPPRAEEIVDAFVVEIGCQPGGNAYRLANRAMLAATLYWHHRFKTVSAVER